MRTGILARFSAPEASVHTRYLVDFTITTSGFKFSVHTAVDVFVDELDLAKLGFNGVEPEATGRPAYHPATLSKIYVYGYS